MSPETSSGAPCASTRAARLSAFTSALSERGASGCTTSRGAAKVTAGWAPAGAAFSAVLPGRARSDGATSEKLNMSAAAPAAVAGREEERRMADLRQKIHHHHKT